MDLEKSIKEWFNQRGFEPYDYQLRSIVKLMNSKSNRVLLAAAPNAGKTTMAVCYITLLKMLYPNIRILVLTHNTVIIRDNFVDEIESSGRPFKYTEITDSHCTFDEDVVIALPATLNRYEELPQFDLVIVDEAHHYYQKKRKKDEHDVSFVKKIIRKVGASKQLLMTGTPSCFNGNKTISKIYVPYMEVYKSGNSAEVYTEIATSRYFTRDDDFNDDGHIKQSYNFTKSRTFRTLDTVLSQIQKRLESKMRKPENYVYGKYVDWAFFKKNMGRTLIACQSGPQAKKVKEYFDSKGIKSVLSISEVDDNSMLREFKNNPDEYTVLIVVFRGVLGYSDKTLMNVVDMTLSRNIDRMFQLFNRSTRKWGSKDKLFIKVVPENAVGRFAAITSGMLCMCEKEWFTKFNGRNFLDMRVPIYRKRRNIGTRSGGGGGETGPNPVQPIEDLGCIPPSEMFYFLKTVDSSKEYNPMYWTDMRTVMNRLDKRNGVSKVMNTRDMIEDFFRQNEGGYIPKLNKDLTQKSIISRAKRIGIYDDLVKKYNMIEHKKKPDGYWKNVNNCLQLAWTCNKSLELKYKSSAAWITLNKLGLLYKPKPEGCGFKLERKPVGYYTLERVLKIKQEADEKGISLRHFNSTAYSRYGKFKKQGLIQENSPRT